MRTEHLFNILLTQPEGSHWSNECKQSVAELRMFSVRQPFPMLMAARRKLDNDDFEKLLRATVVITFRYNVIGGQHTGDQERVYHTAALKLHRDQARTLQDVLEVLRDIYPSDQTFRAAFAEKNIKTTQSRNAKIVRYILRKLEKQSGGIDFDHESAAYTIEHVLPQSPGDGWEAFSDRDLETFVYRLGNMVMLESGKNKDLANKPYAEKRPVLLSSGLHLTSELARENEEWTPERIQRWQEKLAKLATSVWRVAQLSSI